MPYYSVIEILNGYKTGRFTVLDLVRQYFDNIKHWEEQKKINAIITLVDWETIKQHAQAKQQVLEKARKDGKLQELFAKYPLFGVPVVLKDMFVTKGIRTTAGSRVLDNFVPEYNATVTQRLLDAGAIILAKANQDAWAHGSSGENSDFGPTHNPWAFDYVPGGSSSGSAAATIAGYAPIVTGTDTGGSIRQPASFTGTVGIKPTYGRVSRYGIVAMASSLDSIGHFGTNVWDVAYTLGITAGRDAFDATTSAHPVPDYVKILTEVLEDGVVKNLTSGVGSQSSDVKFLTLAQAGYLKNGRIAQDLLKQKPLAGIKIGVLKEGFGPGVDEQVKQVVMQAVEKLQDLGAELVDVSLPELKYGLPLYYIIQTAEVASNLARYDGVRYGNDRTHFGSEAKRRIMLGNYILSDVVEGKVSATTYYKAAQGKALLIKRFGQLMQDIDAFVMPTSPTLPFKLNAKAGDPLQMYMSDLLTVTINIVGTTALALNAGFVDVNNVTLPVGMQVVADFFREDLVFKIGFALETVLENPVERFVQAA